MLRDLNPGLSLILFNKYNHLCVHEAGDELNFVAAKSLAKVLAK